MQTVKPYSVPSWLHESLQMLRPPEDLTVSEWAAAYRQLDIKTSSMPGPWLNDRTPYLVGVMDAFNNYEVSKIVLCFGTQMGKSEAENNIVGYVIDQDPSPTMFVYPTDKLAEWVSENRLVPMIRACPSLNRKFDSLRSQKQELQFQGMYLALVGSNSPSNLASRPIKYLFFDEVDKFPGASKKEADPISLATERLKTFPNSKIVMASTPTLKDGQIWTALESCDVEMHYFVPCPHCGEMIELHMSNLKWPGEESGLTVRERADQAVYACQKCGAVIADYHKDAMLRAGEWRSVKENAPVHRAVGFWINSLYSPFVRFSEMAYEFLTSKDDPERLQNFVNSWLAEPWEDRVNGTDADLVLEHQTDVPEFVVPEWAVLLTAGVDVQHDCLYYTVRAWGAGFKSQNIMHGQVLHWGELTEVLNGIFTREDGARMQISLAYIDSSDGNTSDEVYDYCSRYRDWVTPIKGSAAPMTQPLSKNLIELPSSKANGMKRVMIDTGLFKDWIAGRMHRAVDAVGAWLVYKDCDLEYAQQVTSEHKVREKMASGRYREKWVPKRSHAANHYLDCEVYAFAAAYEKAGRTRLLDMSAPEDGGCA